MDILKTPPQIMPYMPVIPGLFIGVYNRATGNYYGPLGVAQGQTASAVVANKLYAMPFLVLKAETFDRIGTHASTGAEGNGRLGIYNDDGTGKPSSLVLDAGAVDTTTSGKLEISINQTLNPGLYWLACVFNATPSVINAGSTGIMSLVGIGSSVMNQNGNHYGYYTDFAYGELPATHPAPSPTSVATPTLVLRRA